MSTTMEYIGVLVVHECCVCHIKFAVPQDLMDRYWEGRHNSSVNGRNQLFCPLGHSMIPVETNLQKAEREIAVLKSRNVGLTDQLDSTRRARDHQERRAITYRGHLTRVKKRAHAGVCLHCHRTFKDMAEHMKTKHPDHCEGR